MIVYFSGTGNSRFAAEFLAKQLNDELLNAGQRMKAGEKGYPFTLTVLGCLWLPSTHGEWPMCSRVYP